MSYICPKCCKSREPREKLVHQDGKSWLIEFCHTCNFNFEITEWDPAKAPPQQLPEVPKKKRRFRFGLDRDEDL